jgi:hypothetical protein
MSAYISIKSIDKCVRTSKSVLPLHAITVLIIDAIATTTIMDAKAPDVLTPDLFLVKL